MATEELGNAGIAMTPDESDVDDKYVVFKREEFERVLPGYDRTKALLPATGEEVHELPMCFVIRPGDLFAAPALHAYLGLVNTVIEYTQIMTDNPVDGRLEDLRNSVEAFAEFADSHVSKVPDL